MTTLFNNGMTADARFTEEHLGKLRTAFATIETVNPDRLEDFHRLFRCCNDGALTQLANANIKFVSRLARNAQVRRGIA